jgi:CBS domain-containing protein
MKNQLVKDLMTDDFITVQPEAPLADVVALLAANMVRSIPVTDVEGRLLGVISETDLFLKERNAPFSTQKVPTLLGRIIDQCDLDQLDESKQIPVEQVMCREVETATEATPLEEAAMKMMHLGITNLPVVADGKVIGVIRRIDILQSIFGTVDTGNH